MGLVVVGSTIVETGISQPVQDPSVRTDGRVEVTKTPSLKMVMCSDGFVLTAVGPEVGGDFQKLAKFRQILAYFRAPDGIGDEANA